MENTVENDFDFSLELRNQEFAILNKTPQEVIDLVPDFDDFYSRATRNLKKYTSTNPVFNSRRKILLKVWGKILEHKESLDIKYYKRFNASNKGEDVFYAIGEKDKREFQNTTGESRILNVGENLGDLIPIERSEFNELLDRFIEIVKEKQSV